MSGKTQKQTTKPGSSKKDAVVSAAKKAAQLRKRPSMRRTKKHYTTRFYQPKTLKLARSPRVLKTSREKLTKWDNYRVVRAPLTTEKSIGLIESANTLTFVCDPLADKRQIKRAVEQLFSTRVSRVNTLIRLQGDKKAYVRLAADQDALDVANRIGMV